MEPAIQAPFSPEQQKWYEAACAQINRLAATAVQAHRHSQSNRWRRCRRPFHGKVF
jgi:hypothetical protein